MLKQQPIVVTEGLGDSSSCPPVLRIANRHLSVQIMPPEMQTGYYRATRFDWSGVIGDMRSHGHRYVAPWQPQHDPLRHDGITGPVDEFTQIGYEQANPGGEFLKIGVGVLRRPSVEEYDRFRLYEIVDAGSRELISGRDSIEFRHRLLSEEYGYDYRKTIRLTDAPGLRIEYRLKNLGPSALIGSVYNHNFFTLDRMITGVDTLIHFPFTPVGTWREEYDCVALTDDGIAFSRNLSARQSVFMGDLHSQDEAEQHYEFSIRNRKTDAGYRVNGSRSFSHIVFWASARVACLEPYVPFRIFAGETDEWSLDYELLS